MEYININARLIRSNGVINKKIVEEVNNFITGDISGYVDETFWNGDALASIEEAVQVAIDESYLIIEYLTNMELINHGKATTDPKSPKLIDDKITMTFIVKYQQKDCFNTTTLLYDCIWTATDEESQTS